MPRGTTLTAVEQGQIIALHDAGFSKVSIAKRIGRSRTAVQNVLSDPDRYEVTKRAGRKSTLTPSAKRALIREACKGVMSANELRKHLNLPVGTERVKKILQD